MSTPSVVRRILGGGISAEIESSEFTTKLVAATPPTSTPVVPVKPAPAMVTDVPPVAGPVLGDTDEIAGRGREI
jgi:hypothetical protein